MKRAGWIWFLAGALGAAHAADLDSDGRDEALFTLGRTVLALGTTGGESAGNVRWQMELPAQLGPPTVASLSPQDGTVILVMNADGYVNCLR